MAIIKPFKAIRPTRDKAALATSRSYEAYKEDELNAALDFNPYSFLHIIKSGYTENESYTGEERFNLVREKYHEFKNDLIYQKDKKQSYYLHQKTFEDDLFWGIIAVANVEDYQNNVIKKHEATIQQKEELFGNYLNITGFNAEPVLLTYPDSNLINRIYAKYASKRSEYEFTTHTKRTHKFWIIDDDLDIFSIEKEFAQMDCIYIADGHHRSASSNYLANKLKSENPNHHGEEDYNYFMSYLISDANLQITAFDRFIKDLNGLSKTAFLEALNLTYRIENRGKERYTPSKKHHFSMYLDGQYYSLYLRNMDYKINNAKSDLDPHIIYKTIIKPILGIEDLSTDTRIKCLPAKFDDQQLKNQVDSGKYKVGFRLFPVSTTQLKAVADENLKMPPKSTYIEPKLRSGLTIFEMKAH
ncbi:MAG: hypothetical protein COB60_04780 [Flavobacteriaceae bacterium]|nr:MAG: hypothetical protein COB60_04780 [Flavobacteriaceae bacterium]